MNTKAKHILNRLENCPVNFDPNHNHKDPAKEIPKVAFIPADLLEEIKDFLKSPP